MSRTEQNYAGEEFDISTAALLAPKDYVNPKPRSKYHLVVIGAGPAGLVTAMGAAGLGARVALIERARMGGDCLNVGCIPSKALLQYTASCITPQFHDAFRFARQARAQIAPHDSVARYTERGVDVFLGEAAFVDDRSVSVGDTLIRARRFALCTGARAFIPPIDGLAACDPLTNETVFDLTSRPASIAILGAGVIGCELSQVFARLGVAVHLYEMANRVLPTEDPEASAAVARSLVQCGVQLHLGTVVESTSTEQGKIVVSGAGESSMVEQVLVALGRVPNTDGLNLEAADVALDEDGYIVTDQKLRTSNRRIYAAGDCTSRAQFTHNADAQAKVVLQNALFLPSASISKHVVPRCTYTDPEVAVAGKSEADLIEEKCAYDCYRLKFSDLDRGRTQADSEGFAKIFVGKGGDEILGVTVVGTDAGEQIATICVLMSNGLGLQAIARTIFAYPTRSEWLKRVAADYTQTRLTPRIASLFRRWFQVTDSK